MARHRALTGPAHIPAQDAEITIAPTIRQLSDAWTAVQRDAVAVCRMVYAWKTNGGPERDCKRDPEKWDRYLASVFGLVASSIRQMVGQGETYARLSEFRQAGKGSPGRFSLENLRQSHLAALAPLRFHDGLLAEALAAGQGAVEDGRRLTAKALKETVGSIRQREGLAKIVGGGLERIGCEACSGKGWTYAEPGPPGARPLATP